MQTTKTIQNTLVFRTRPVLRWKDAGGAWVVLPVESLLVVGSAPERGVQVVLPSPTVSRIHAELMPDSSGLWVRDLGSRNGTVVAGVQVERARIPDGAVVKFGDCLVEVTYEKAAELAEQSPSPKGFGGMVGETPVMRRCYTLLERAAQVDAPVLITGETGVGKDVAANAIHDASCRANKRFVIVDCGALPESLLEAELFGHAKGAFTGASTARVGAFEAAEGGTLFIDEVGEIPLSLQPKLLRMLEARAVRRIGETHYRKIDTRVVAATHRDLRAMVNQGTFREDLYFRLAVLPIHIPPLRERREDIPGLLEKFINGRPLTFEADQMADLCARPWTGNIRELRNFVDRALALGVARAIELSFGDIRLADEQGPVSVQSRAAPTPVEPEPTETLEDYRGRAERSYLTALLERHQYNISHAAKAAGIGRGHLYRLMHRWNL